MKSNVLKIFKGIQSKNKVLFLFLNSITFTLCSEDMQLAENINQNTSHTIQEVKEAIEKISVIISSPQTKVTCFLGTTGVGKSTFMNYLAGKKLIVKDGIAISGRPELIIDTKDEPLPKSSISHSLTSETTYPSHWEDYWDCPGFGDNRGPVTEIASAYSIYRLINSSQNSRFLIFCSEDEFRDRAQGIDRLIKFLGNTFLNIDDFVRSSCLVVSKSQLYGPTNEGVLKNFFKQLLQQRTNLTLSQKKILEFLAAHDSPVIFFPRPQSSEDTLDAVEKHRTSILETIDSIPYSDQVKVGISISSDTHIFVRDLYEDISTDLSSFIFKELLAGSPPKIQRFVEDFINLNSKSLTI